MKIYKTQAEVDKEIDMTKKTTSQNTDEKGDAMLTKKELLILKRIAAALESLASCVEEKQDIVNVFHAQDLSR